ncbi:MAG: stage II sporulation protein P [bacterium]|nr:stage II sporulation protein P [bacterium]
MIKLNRTARRLAVTAGAAVLLLLLLQGIIGRPRTGSTDAAEEAGERSLRSFMLRELADVLTDRIYDSYMLCIPYTEGKRQDTYWIIQEQIDSLLPLYGYAAKEKREEDQNTEISFREILLAEAQEGPSPDQDYSEEERENPQAEGEKTLTQLFEAENEALRIQEGQMPFVPRGKTEEVDIAALQDYETLLKQFYIVDSNTMAGSDQLNVESFLEKDMTVQKDGTGPQILIFHTHSQESFADSRQGEPADSIVGVGDRLTQILTETYGYTVLHHTAEYDAQTRNDAYSRALPGVSRVLEENPSIQVVIDLHRDEMPEDTRLVMDLDGRPTARFMFFNGLSRTKKTGNIAYLYNENLENNLAFSFQMQLKAAEYYPGLTRKIYLKGYRYNMHLKDKYLLIELGAQNNTVEEAMNACEPLAHILDLVLSGE